MKFLIHGSIAYDLLLGFEGNFADIIGREDIEKLSVSFFSPRLTRHHGGTAANIAWNLALLKQETELVGVVGNDGDEYLSTLKKRGIGTSYVETLKDHVTAFAVIGTDTDERQIAFFHPGADAYAKLPLFKKTPACDFAIVSARNPMLMIAGAMQLHDQKTSYLFDPGQQSHIFGRDDLTRAVKGSAGLVVNEYEWAMARDVLEWEEQDVVDACGLLVITLGEKGVKAFSRDGNVTIEAAKPQRVVNPTGAGDALRAGLLTGLASKWPLPKSLQLGATLASFIVEQEGALLASLEISALSERFEHAYGGKLIIEN